MRDRSTRRERFMRDDVPVRLGGIAANLARVYSFSDHAGHGRAVESLIDESKFFIEWTAPYAESEPQVELVALQLQLAQWQRTWATIWEDPEQRKTCAETALQWSAKVLALSGLLKDDARPTGRMLRVPQRAY